MTDQVTDIVDSTVIPPADEVEFARGDNFLFIELAQLTNGKPFAGFTVGEFTDMFGRVVKISGDKFKAFLTNTSKAIDLMKKRGMPGLPIDEKLHDKGHAAGWITNAEAGEIVDHKGAKRPALFFAVDWTSLGINLISEKIQTNFSPTVDLQNSVIRGGSLTNWPATLDENGIPLFNALELSQNLYQLFEQATAENETPAPIETPHMEKQIMLELTEQELSAKITDAVTAALAAQPKPEPTTQVDLSQLVEAFGLNIEKAEEQGMNHLNELAKQVEQQVNLKWQNILAEKQRENRYAELSVRVTGGTTDYPRALPVAADNLRNALLKLPAEQAGFWMELCQNIVKNGLTEFSEFGHGREKKQGTKVLDPKIAATLKSHVNAGGEIAAWFELAELGAPEDYDLSAFEKGK